GKVFRTRIASERDLTPSLRREHTRHNDREMPSDRWLAVVLFPRYVARAQRELGGSAIPPPVPGRPRRAVTSASEHQIQPRRPAVGYLARAFAGDQLRDRWCRQHLRH